MSLYSLPLLSLISHCNSYPSDLNIYEPTYFSPQFTKSVKNTRAMEVVGLP